MKIPPAVPPADVPSPFQATGWFEPEWQREGEGPPSRYRVGPRPSVYEALHLRQLRGDRLCIA